MTQSRPAALCLPHKATGLPADLTNEKTALLHGSQSSCSDRGSACLWARKGCTGFAVCLFHTYKLIKVYHIH